MKKIITTALATMVAVFGYSQQYLPLTGGNLTGEVRVDLPSTGNSFVGTGLGSNFHFNHDGSPTVRIINTAGGGFSLNGALTGTSAIFSGSGIFGGNIGAANGTFSGKLIWGEGTYMGGNAQLYNHATSGTVFVGKAGASTDFLLANSAGGTVMSVPTGSQNLNLAGGLTGISATFTAPRSLIATGADVILANSGGAHDIIFGDNNMRYYSLHTPAGAATGSIRNYSTATDILSWTAGGAASFSSSVSATSATFDSPRSLITTGNDVILANSGGTHDIIFGDNNMRYYSLHTPTGAASGSIRNYSTATDILSWTSGGNVTIGTTDTQNHKLAVAGSVGIGSPQTNSNLYVHGTIKSKEVKVEATVTVPDYVFEKSYNLKPLTEVEQYITQNKHLPEIPSAKEIAKEGINVGEMQMALLKKIEELTLHLITQNKQIEGQSQRLERQEKENADLKKRLSEIEERNK